MKYLLDTNTVIGLLERRPGLEDKLRRRDVNDFGLPVIVTHELFYGAYKSRMVIHNLDRVDELPFEVVDFDKEDARHAGEVRAALGRDGMPIGPYDVLIAGQARSRDLVLITRNIREFRCVPNLEVEDWEGDS